MILYRSCRIQCTWQCCHSEPDILWHNDNGGTAIWEMQGTTVIGGGIGNPGPHVKGTGDFFGNIPTSSGRTTTARWRSGRSTALIPSAAAGISTNPSPIWHVMGTGNYNGATQSDTLFQNTNGAATVWEGSGTSITAGSTLPHAGSARHI